MRIKSLESRVLVFLYRFISIMIFIFTSIKSGLSWLFLIDKFPNFTDYLIPVGKENSENYSETTRQIIGDSVQTLWLIDKVAMLICDPERRIEHEAPEFEVLTPRLISTGVVIPDNSHAINELSKWSLRNGRRFFYFAEELLNHWCPGAGISVYVNC